MKVLIVDYSKFSRFNLKMTVLDVFPDWEIVESSDGRHALRLLDTNVFDIFFIDINMPQMDCFELFQLVKKKSPNTPMALMTAHEKQSNHPRTAVLGLYIIYKPINENKLREFLLTVGLVG